MIIAILLTLIIWGLIFYLLFWLVNFIGLADPFRKVFLVILVVATVIVIIGLLTGSIAPFPIVSNLF